MNEIGLKLQGIDYYLFYCHLKQKHYHSEALTAYTFENPHVLKLEKFAIFKTIDFIMQIKVHIIGFSFIPASKIKADKISK